MPYSRRLTKSKSQSKRSKSKRNTKRKLTKRGGAGKASYRLSQQRFLPRSVRIRSRKQRDPFIYGQADPNKYARVWMEWGRDETERSLKPYWKCSCQMERKFLTKKSALKCARDCRKKYA